MLRCIHCDNSIDLTYQCKQLKEAENKSLKNKIDWLDDFINLLSWLIIINQAPPSQ